MSIYPKERIQQFRGFVIEALKQNIYRFKAQGNCWCQACTKNRTRYVMPCASTLSGFRVCDDCFEKGKWHLFTKPRIMELLKKEYTSVPNDIWNYFLLFLEWTVE